MYKNAKVSRDHIYLRVVLPTDMLTWCVGLDKEP